MGKKLTKLVTALFVLLTAAGSLLAGGQAVFAATKPATGTLTIHKYLGAELNQGTYPADGTEITDVPDTVKPVKDVVFDVYKVGTPVTPNTGENWTKGPDQVPGNYNPGSQQTVVWNYQLISVNGTDYLEVTSVESPAKVHRYNLTALPEQDRTNTNGVIEVNDGTGTDLNGDYFVVENLTKSYADSATVPTVDNGATKVAITKPAAPFIVSVPMTNRAGDDWIEDVHVYPKNQETDITKEPQKPTLDVGESVTWEIAVELPEDIIDYKRMEIKDTLDEALNYTPNSVKVYQAEKSGNKWVKVSPESVLNSTNYIVTYADPTLTVSLSHDGIPAGATDGFAAVAGWEGLIIEFDTSVNETAITDGRYLPGLIPNTATVEFTNQHGQDSEKPSNDTKVTTGTIEIIKVDQDKKNLVGAKFQIAASEEDAKAGKFLKKDTDGNILHPGTETGGGDSQAYTNANKWEEVSTLTGTSPNQKATATFAGLKSHDDTAPHAPKSYWIVETEAPDGFNLPDGPIEVTFAAYDKDDVASYIKKEFTVENRKGFKLPNTGGMGLVMTIVAGIILIGGAVLLLMPKKRRS